MKREYRKPTIHVEVLSLDMPIATSCQAYDDSYELRAQGWFFTDCQFKQENAADEMKGIGDTLCYHSHARTIFSS